MFATARTATRSQLRRCVRPDKIINGFSRLAPVKLSTYGTVPAQCNGTVGQLDVSSFFAVVQPVRKQTPFFARCRFVLETMFLPRQAQDKHRGKNLRTTNSAFS
jgi:hypothetical protein